jgi:hypothetical protein
LQTLKTKVGDVVGCIFEVKCSVGGFFILKQIILKVHSKIKKHHLLFFFFNSLSLFTVLVLRSAFSSFSFLCAAGLRGTFPGHPHPPSLLLFSFWTTQHEIQHKHPWEAHPAWDLNPADLAVVSGEHV